MAAVPRLDHLVLATPNIESTVDWVAHALGVRPIPGGQHLGFGTRNFLLGLGPRQYLEVIGRDPDQPEPPEPRPFAIDVIDRPRLTAWVAKSSDLEAAVAKAAQHRYDLGPIRAMSRSTPDGRVLRWRLTRTRASEVTVIPLLIDWGDTPHPSSSAPSGTTLVSFAAEDPQPDQVRQVLAALGLELPVTTGHEPRLMAQLSGPAGKLELN